jgi:hypothetical protein
MATVVTGWLSPVLLCASLLLMARSFYVIYVKKVTTRLTTVITWLACIFMVSFWTWYLLLGGDVTIRGLFQSG